MDHSHPTTNRPGLSRSWTTPASFGGLRVMPWRGDAHVALIGPRRDGRRPSSIDILHCLEELKQRGVVSAITPALGVVDAKPFEEAGLQLHENLHLLAKTLDDQFPKAGLRLTRGRPWHINRVLDIDADAFEPFWQFDRISLREARRATPSSRFRVATIDGVVAGYAVTGRAGDRGYLQRLAVAPALEGRGLGTALVSDGFRWLKKRGAVVVMVNTQEHNKRALDLYEHLGFVKQDPGLVVLRWDTSE